MKYRGKEIVAPKEFLEAMQTLLDWYTGEIDTLDYCPLCDVADSFSDVPNDWTPLINCGICPWTITQQNLRKKPVNRLAGAPCEHVAIKLTNEVASMCRGKKIKKWKSLRIKQLTRWIKIYEKAAADDEYKANIEAYHDARETT